MRLLKTIRMDASDTFVFDAAAEPGEWAVTGAFLFAHLDPLTLSGKRRAAFRGGFLGIATFGWSTLVQVVEASEADREAAIKTLATQLVERLGAPDLATALPAAAEEIDFAASLSNHPSGTVVAMSRRCEAGVTHEAFRSLMPREPLASPLPFTFLDSGEEDAPMESIDLAKLAQGERG